MIASFFVLFLLKNLWKLCQKGEVGSLAPSDQSFLANDIFLFWLFFEFWEKQHFASEVLENTEKNEENPRKPRVFGAISFLVALIGCGDRTWTCDLRVMSPTSYQLLYPAIYGAGNRARTGTGYKSHGILSPGRLPIPPLRHLPISDG